MQIQAYFFGIHFATKIFSLNVHPDIIDSALMLFGSSGASLCWADLINIIYVFTFSRAPMVEVLRLGVFTFGHMLEKVGLSKQLSEKLFRKTQDEC
jgi:hypothetical protein